MNPSEVIELKKNHLLRFANESGAKGEILSIEANEDWIPRPKGDRLKNLLSALELTGLNIKRSSFDALSIPADIEVDFGSIESILEALPKITFIEIKTANQERVKEDFSGFFFALTESEISAAEQLGDRHKVALFNKRTSKMVMTTVSDIVAKSRSMTWQVSVQL
ncbi:hypothetical protein [Vibrio vulnificus]|uniref:hypothetical protein n=1 Tax=Vibrio vulnificus TaxID=672 RepID=UPI001EEA5E29|nr:hypothetical protein [Vibrio vulnificus]MCG6311839.1 hypothetical protein [Vibrio vulnificus]MDS1842093.1 hypothetical protein [Vibrio vulnificus]MDS1850720.1 hypothetical protein [Vibrio vulnificus]